MIKPLSHAEQLAWQRQCIMEDYQDTGDHGFQRFAVPRHTGGWVNPETKQLFVQPAAKLVVQSQKAPQYALAD